MTTYVALLRGINVGGKKAVRMAELRALVEALGHEDVVTYVQSGNVVLTSLATAAAVERGIEQAIDRELGLSVSVMTRTRPQLAKVVAANPYATARIEPTKVHVVFLADRPKAAAVKALDPDRSPPDEFTVHGREIFLDLPNGAGRSKLTIDWFERHLATRATARNWATVTTLLELTERSGKQGVR